MGSQYIIDALDAQELLRMSTVDRSFVINPTVISAHEIQLLDMPLVVEDFTPSQGFVLDHSTYGVLNTSKLDATGMVFSLVKISNPNDIFNFLASEQETALIVHSSTTATINNTNQTVAFTAGQILVLRCYIDTFTVTAATFTTDAAAFDDESNYTFALSANGGSGYTNVDNGTEYSFPSVDQGTELRLRITAAATGTVSIRELSGKVHPLQTRYVVS